MPRANPRAGGLGPPARGPTAGTGAGGQAGPPTPRSRPPKKHGHEREGGGRKRGDGGAPDRTRTAPTASRTASPRPIGEGARAEGGGGPAGRSRPSPQRGPKPPLAAGGRIGRRAARTASPRPFGEGAWAEGGGVEPTQNQSVKKPRTTTKTEKNHQNRGSATTTQQLNQKYKQYIKK